MKPLMEMANVVGKFVKRDHIDFSFYFSDKAECNHGIRVKIFWNRERTSGSPDGYMELHGNYEYVQSHNGQHPSIRDLNHVRLFFQKYKVLFAAVWEMKLDPIYVQDYLRENIELDEVIENLEVGTANYEKLMNVSSIEELGYKVVEYSMFNMHE